MKLRYLPFLLWYSVKEIFKLPGELFDILKRAKTWSFIFYLTMFMLIYYHKATWTSYVVISALILLVYFVRQKNEPRFNEALREKAFMKNDSEILMKYFRRYCQECFYTHKQPVEYEEWKKREIDVIAEKRNRLREMTDAQ